MVRESVESPLAKAWKRLKKNYPAMFSLFVIIAAIILAVIAPVIAPDGTPDANDQVLEITNENPGFTIDMLLVRKNRAVRESNILSSMFVGRDNPYAMVPVNEVSFHGKYVVAEVYKGGRYESEIDSFTLADILYPISPEEPIIETADGKLEFSDFRGNKVSATVTELQDRIKSGNIVSKTYKLGTDKFGRDILSRLLFGLRVSISVGFVAVFISLVIGISLGAMAGYFRNDKIRVSRGGAISLVLVLTGALVCLGFGLSAPVAGFLGSLANIGIMIGAFFIFRLILKRAFQQLTDKVYFPFDDVAMLLINVVWSIPTILLAMALSFSLGNWIESFWVIYIAVGLSMWVEVARIVRGQVMIVRELEYVQAARGLGFNNPRIIARHILPNIIGPIMVITAANFAAAILIEAGLSFIGIGVQPPKPSWGIMLSENRNYLKVAGKAFLALAPGIAIMILVLAFNLLGNGLRDAFDVQSKNT